MTTYITSPELIVSHIHPNKFLMDKHGEVNEMFIKGEVNRLKRLGIKDYLFAYKISKDKLCQYFTKMTSSLKPITDIQLSS